MEFLQLRYFYETTRTESISKTANRYMVPASSVTAAIKRLSVGGIFQELDEVVETIS